MTQADLLRYLAEALEGLGAEYKLLYHGERDAGEPSLHLRDVIGIVRVSGPELDEPYIREWAERLGVAALWGRVRAAAGAV